MNLFLMSVNFCGINKTTIKFRLICPSSFLWILPNKKNWFLLVDIYVGWINRHRLPTHYMPDS